MFKSYVHFLDDMSEDYLSSKTEALKRELDRVTEELGAWSATVQSAREIGADGVAGIVYLKNAEIDGLHDLVARQAKVIGVYERFVEGLEQDVRVYSVLVDRAIEILQQARECSERSREGKDACIKQDAARYVSLRAPKDFR